MKREWLGGVLRPFRSALDRLRRPDRTDLLLARLDELDRSVARLAREQAKTVVELEASNRTQEQLAGEFSRALRRLEDGLQRRNQSEAAEREAGIREGRQALIGEAVDGIVGLLDGLRRAAGAVPISGTESAWLEGLETVMARGEAVLANWGIEPTSAPGMAFDPELHEAVGVVEGDGGEQPLIGEELLRGYRIGNQVLRIAKVVVVWREQDHRDRPGHDELSSGSDRDGRTPAGG